MKINKTALVALLVAVGFEKAKSLNNERLQKMIPEIPDKIKPDDVTDAHKAVYEKIRTANGSGDDFELVDDTADEKKKKGAVDRAVDKAAAKKGGKPAKAPKAPKEKREPPVRDMDVWGVTKDSTRGRVNAAVEDGDWHTIEDVAKAANVENKVARGKLRRMVRLGHFEVEKIVRYRVKPGAKSAAKSGKK